MMEAKHTVGPWWCEDLYLTIPEANARVVICATSHKDTQTSTRIAEATYVSVKDGYHVSSRDEAEANARLIAAAPDLLEALQALCKIQEQADGGVPTWAGEWDDAFAAIAKATGDAA